MAAILLGWMFRLLRYNEVKYTLLGLFIGLSVWYLGAGAAFHRTIWFRANGLHHRVLRNSGSGCHCTIKDRKQNIYFLKVHKSGSTTLASIFVRHAKKHKLILGKTTRRVTGWIGWPSPMMPKHLWKASIVDKKLTLGGPLINVIAMHSIYNRDTVKSVMPADTASIGILRSPFSHFQSLFDYYQFNIAKQVKLEKFDAMKEYLENPEKYEKPFFSKKWVRNFQFTEFGYADKDVTNVAAISSYIKYLDNNFLTVAILEHLDESLILLRRLLCWKIEDIIVLHMNKNNHKVHAVKKGTEMYGYLRRLHEQWSTADYMLYDHFNQTLWQQIKLQGSTFYSELRFYRLLMKDIKRFCQGAGGDPYRVSRAIGDSEITVSNSDWTDEFRITRATCTKLSKRLYANVDLFVNKIP
ncbi:galactose-3-O-sulfotransferase 4-like isoform X2 [Lineus longissimus]